MTHRPLATQISVAKDVGHPRDRQPRLRSTALKLESIRWLIRLAFLPLVPAIVSASEPPAITIISATQHLPGRFDYIAPGGSLRMEVSAPDHEIVDWYKDGDVISSTLGGNVELSSLTTRHTGNYSAKWTENGRLEETTLQPITIGPLPRSNFTNQSFAAGGTSPNRGGISLVRELDDNRIFATHSSYGGVGRYWNYYLLSPDLTNSNRILHVNSQFGDTPLSGVLNDGAFLISEPPYLFRERGLPLPFNLPTELNVEDSYLHAFDIGGGRILLKTSRKNIVIGTARDGTSLFDTTLESLGFDQIIGTTVRSDGSVYIHGTLAHSTDVPSMTGAIIRIDPDNVDALVDASFLPIPLNSVPVNDGTWGLLSERGYQRFNSTGQLIDERQLSIPPGGNASLAPDGNIYVTLDGLGVIRFLSEDLLRDPQFFLPHQLDPYATTLRPVLVTSEDTIVAIGSPYYFSSHYLSATLTVDNDGSIPIISRHPMALTLASDNSTSSIQTFRDDLYQAPRTGLEFELHCDFYGVGTLTPRWVALDNTTAVTTTTAGSMKIAEFSKHYAGRYQLVVANENGRALGPIVDFRPNGKPRLSNLSGRARVDSGDRTAVAGFVLREREDTIAGNDDSVPMLIRGMGPALTDFDVQSPLLDPTLDLNESTRGLVAQNDDWGTESRLSYSVMNRLGAFTTVATSADSSLYRNLSAGVYSALTHAKTYRYHAGIALTEIYIDHDFGTDALELSNLSFRGYAGTGDNVLVGGFVIVDPDLLSRSLKLLIRAVGPTLSEFEVTPALADPVLNIFDSEGNLVASNNDWTLSVDHTEIAAKAEQFGAFSLPENSLDSAILITLPAGAYTAQVEPRDASEGIALLEIYLLSSE